MRLIETCVCGFEFTKFRNSSTESWYNANLRQHEKSTRHKFAMIELYTKGIHTLRVLNEILKFGIYCCCGPIVQQSTAKIREF